MALPWAGASWGVMGAHCQVPGDPWRGRDRPTRGPCLTISLPQMLQVLCSDPCPLCACPQLLKVAAFSGELLLTTGSRRGPEGLGVDSLTSGQFSDNDWLTWGPTHLHSCLKLGQLYGGVYAPEPHWDQAEARAQRSPCPYLAPSPPSPSLLSSSFLQTALLQYLSCQELGFRLYFQGYWLKTLSSPTSWESSAKSQGDRHMKVEQPAMASQRHVHAHRPSGESKAHRCQPQYQWGDGEPPASDPQRPGVGERALVLLHATHSGSQRLGRGIPHLP